MTYKSTHFTSAPKGYTLEFDKLYANMSEAEKEQVETIAQSYDAICTRDEVVWTVDSANNAIVPRGKRPTA